MQLLLVALTAIILAMTADADTRPRATFFLRQTASSTEKPASGNEAPYPPSGSGGPYPPSGWKPDGPQLEQGPPGKPQTGNPDKAEAANDTTPTDPQSSAPAKLVSFVKPEGAPSYYFVLADGRVQPLVVSLPKGALVQVGATSSRLTDFNPRPQAQLQQVLTPRSPDFAYTGPLLRVFTAI